MPRSRAEDEEELKHWRELLPGAADDQIVIPRYHARDFRFPAEGSAASNWGEAWQRGWMFFAINTHGNMPKLTPKDHATMSRVASKTFRAAVKWWKSFDQPTALELNQSLYTRCDKWKSPLDMPEFIMSWALCVEYLRQPASERSSTVAIDRVRAQIDELIELRKQNYYLSVDGEVVSLSKE